jgi:hypothetical protein
MVLRTIRNVEENEMSAVADDRPIYWQAKLVRLGAYSARKATMALLKVNTLAHGLRADDPTSLLQNGGTLSLRRATRASELRQLDAALTPLGYGLDF